MDLQVFFENVAGEWKGVYRLWVNPDQDSEESVTTAESRLSAPGRFLLFTYTWARRGRDHEGVFLLGGNRTGAFATWLDSWHMANEPMVCTGSLVDEGELVLNGRYSAGHTEWRWRTELIHKDRTTLTMKAFNISPDGQEVLAVRSEMERVIIGRGRTSGGESASEISSTEPLGPDRRGRQ